MSLKKVTTIYFAFEKKIQFAVASRHTHYACWTQGFIMGAMIMILTVSQNAITVTIAVLLACSQDSKLSVNSLLLTKLDTPGINSGEQLLDNCLVIRKIKQWSHWLN